jgi:glycosyltransferase involved in cell wall biosynthesis
MTPKGKQPLVSILLRFYNDEKYIRPCLGSILNQDYQNIEVILVNNKSEDNSQAIINEYLDDKRIKILCNDKNIIGGAYNFRKAFKTSRGKYIVFFCADDIMNKNCISNKVDFLEKNQNYLACFSHLECIDEKGKPKNKNLESIKKDDRYQYLRRIFDYYYCVAFPGAMTRKESFIYDAMDLRLLNFFDIKLWINILLNGDIAVLDECHVKYRQHGENASAIYNNKEKYTTYLFELHFLYDEFFKINNFEIIEKIFPEADSLLTKIDKKTDQDLIPIIVAILLYNNEKFSPFHFGIHKNIALLKILKLLEDENIYHKVSSKLIDANKLIELYSHYNEGLDMNSVFKQKSIWDKTIFKRRLRKKRKSLSKNNQKIEIIND